MSSAAAPTTQAPAATTPATTAEASSAPAPATSSPTPTPTSQAAQTTAPQSTAAPSSSTPAANSPTSTTSNAAASSSAGDTSSSSTTTKTSSSSSASKVSLTSSLSFVVQTSDGQVFTQTSVVTVPASTPTDSSQSSRSAPTSFFHNTGAVAGVFSVVGIIALVLIFVLLTSFVRRRRARKFDREIDEAAAVAAAAQAPDFDDFDYTSGTGVGYAQYSETSHGTYNQPPLSHERSRNNLSDIPASLDTHNSTGGPAGAAGIGARGRSLRSGMQDPFGALTNPPEQYEMTESRRSWHQGSLRGGGGTEVTTYDMLQAAGMSGSDPYAVTRAPSTRLANLPMQSGVSGLMRSQSQGTSTLPTTAENYPMPTAAPAYPGGQDRPYPPEKARYSGLYTPAGDADVYSGYQDQPSVPLDNPHSPGLPAPPAQDEHEDVAEQFEPSPFPHGREEPARASLADDEDYGYNIGNRVLRVANE